MLAKLDKIIKTRATTKVVKNGLFVKEEQTISHLLYGTLGSLTGITLLTGIIISSNSQVSATASSHTVNSDVSVTVQSSCTMVGNIASEQDQHTKSVNPGTYTSDIGLTTITAYCNDVNGFTINAIGYSNDTDGNNTMIDTTNSSNYFPSGTLQSGSTSQWAMKIGTTASTYTMNVIPEFSDYNTVPTTSTPVAYRTASTDVGTGATGTNITTTYAAYISGTQTAGTYQGKVKYTLTHPNSYTPPVTMQNFAAGITSTTCADMSTGDTITLTDSRDNTEYTIGKLADGKCWMLDNLALDVVARIDDMNEDNTNASNTTLGYLKNGGGSGQYATAGVTNWSGTSYTEPVVRIDNKDIVPQGYDDDPMASTVLAGGWKVGGYYNYCAASAGSYCYSPYSSTGNANESICPKGWRLPTSNTGGEFATLYGLYNNYTNFRNAFHLPLSGYFYNGSAGSQGSDGNWWSSTRNGDGDMYSLYADTSDIYPSDSSYRYGVYSVRCVMGS